jgi:hypothetical protein
MFTVEKLLDLKSVAERVGLSPVYLRSQAEAGHFQAARYKDKILLDPAVVMRELDDDATSAIRRLEGALSAHRLRIANSVTIAGDHERVRDAEQRIAYALILQNEFRAEAHARGDGRLIPQPESATLPETNQ